MREIKHVQGRVELRVNFLDLPGDFAGVAARTVGSNNHRNHKKRMNDTPDSGKRGNGSAMDFAGFFT